MKGESSKDVSCPCRTCYKKAEEFKSAESSSFEDDDDEIVESKKDKKHYSSGKSQKEPHDPCGMIDDHTWKTLISLRQKACKFLNSEAEDLSAISDATLDNEEFRPGPNFMKKAQVLIDYEPESAFLRKIKENYLQNNDIQKIMAACSSNTYAICEDCSDKVKSKLLVRPEDCSSKTGNASESRSRESRGEGCKCRSQGNMNSHSGKRLEMTTPNKDSSRGMRRNQNFDAPNKDSPRGMRRNQNFDAPNKDSPRGMRRNQNFDTPNKGSSRGAEKNQNFDTPSRGSARGVGKNRNIDTPSRDSARGTRRNQNFDSISFETKSQEYRGKENKERNQGQKSLHKSRSKRRISKEQRRQQAEVSPSQDQFEPTLKRPHENSCERCWKYASTSRSPVNRPDQRYDPNFRKAHSCTEILTPKGGEGNFERHVVCKDLEPVKSSQSRVFPPQKQRPHTAQFPLQNSEYSKRSQPHPTPQSPPAYTEVKETNFDYSSYDSPIHPRRKHTTESSHRRPGSATYGYRRLNDDFQTTPSKRSNKVSSVQRPKTGPSPNQKRAAKTFSYHSPEEMNKTYVIPEDSYRRHPEVDPYAQRQSVVDPRQPGYGYEKPGAAKNYYYQQPMDSRFQGAPTMDDIYLRPGVTNNLHQQPVLDHCYQRQPPMDPYLQRQVPMDPYFQKQPAMNYKFQKPGPGNNCFQQKHPYQPHQELHQFPQHPQQYARQQQPTHSRHQSPPMANQNYQSRGGMSNMYEQQGMDPCYQRQAMDHTYQKSGRMNNNFQHPTPDPCNRRPPAVDYDCFLGPESNEYQQEADSKFLKSGAPKTHRTQSGSPQRFMTATNGFESSSKCRCSPPIQEETIQEEEDSKPKVHPKPSSPGHQKSMSPSLELSVSIAGHKKKASTPRSHSASQPTTSQKRDSESRRPNQDFSFNDVSRASHPSEFEETQYMEFERKMPGAAAPDNYESHVAAGQRQASTPKKSVESPKSSKSASERRSSKASKTSKGKKQSASGKRSRSSSLKNFDQKKSLASGSPKSSGRPRTAGSAKSGTKKRNLSKSPRTKSPKTQSRIEEYPEDDEYMPTMPSQPLPLPYGQSRVLPCAYKTDNVPRMILSQKHPVNECKCSFKIPKSRPTLCCHCDEGNLHVNVNNEESFYRNPDPSYLRQNYHDTYDTNESRNYSSYNPDYSFNIDDGSYRYSEPEYSLGCIDPVERSALQQQCYRECLRQLSERCRSRGPAQGNRHVPNFGGNPPRKYSVFYMTKSKEGEGNDVEVIVEELTQKISNEKVPKSKPAVEKMKKILDCPMESMALKFQKGVSEANENPPSTRILYF